MLRELLKYHPRQVDYTETDPALIRLARIYLDTAVIPDDPRIRYVLSRDGAGFLKKNYQTYNAVIVNTDAPFTLSGNRYFSLAFARLVKEHLTPDGVMSLALPTGYNYTNKNALELNSLVYNTLSKVFKNVTILQGQQNYFLASDSPLSEDVPGLIARKGIETSYVNENYLSTQGS